MPTTDYKTRLLSRLADTKYAAGYLNAALAEGEDVFLLALRDIVESRGGMTWLAKGTGLNRVTLYRLLSGRGNPTLASLSVIMRSVGLEIGCHPAPRDRRSAA